ncbi:MAG: DUF3794 domain-containing protein [Defluviitaleaceae bacterium]|nr:DUF3794 domain-containing protein [Defluviitaleaceae bacterium]
MELVRENIILNRHMGREKSQLLLEGDIIVPEAKPDIVSVLKTGARVSISKITAGSGRIGFSGKMRIDVLYTANSGEISVHSLSAQAFIDDFINMEGIEPHMWVDLTAELANVDYRIVNDRKLNYRAVIDITADAWEKRDFDAVKSIDGLGAAQQKNAFFTMSNMVAKQMEHFTVRDEITLPPSKPAISELLQVSVDIANKDVRLADGRVDVSGNLIISPLYKSSEEEALIEFADFELPFSGSLDVGIANSQAFGDVNLSISDFIVDLVADADGNNKILGIETTISADIKISESQQMDILEDAYCIDQHLDITAENMEYQRLICRNRNQFNLKETVQLSGAPEILQILQVSGTARIEDTRVIDDKVVVEGLLEADILFVANSDTDPIFNYTAHLPIRQTIETKGAVMGMEAQIAHGIDQISFNMLGGNEVELRFNLNFDTLIQEAVSTKFIQEIEFSPLDKEVFDALPSMVILAAEKGDSLWSVAKKYNADLEELAKINNLEVSDNLFLGQKLLVVKKVSEE